MKGQDTHRSHTGQRERVWFGVDPALQQYSILSWVYLHGLDISGQPAWRRKITTVDADSSAIRVRRNSALNQPVILKYPLSWYSCWLIDEVLTRAVE